MIHTFFYLLLFLQLDNTKIELNAQLYHTLKVISKYENNGVAMSFSLSGPQKTFYFDNELYIREVEVKGSKIMIDGIDFTIGLIDKNNNGVFNESNVDEIIIEIGHVDSVYLSDCNTWIYKINEKDEVNFKVNHKSYTIHGMDSEGRFLHLSPMSLENYQVNNINTNLLNVQLDTVGNSMIIDQKGGHKYIIAELWWAGCAACLRAVPKVNEISSKYKNDILVIGLNHVDRKNLIHKYVDKYAMLYPQYTISKSDLESLGPLCKSFPRAMLFDSNGNLLSNDFDLDMIGQLLE